MNSKCSLLVNEKISSQTVKRNKEQYQLPLRVVSYEVRYCVKDNFLASFETILDLRFRDVMSHR